MATQMRLILDYQVLNAPQDLLYIIQQANFEAVNIFVEHMVMEGERGAGSGMRGTIPVNTGALLANYKSIVYGSSVGLGGLNMHFQVGFASERLPYAKYMDKGRKPGAMPPVGAIAAWIQTKGIPIPPGMSLISFAWAIAKRIAEEGTKAYRLWGGYKFTERLFPEAKQWALISISRAYQRRGIGHRIEGKNIVIM